MRKSRSCDKGEFPCSSLLVCEYSLYALVLCYKCNGKDIVLMPTGLSLQRRLSVTRPTAVSQEGALIFDHANSVNPRGVTPIGAVSRAAIGVKMQSNGQALYWAPSPAYIARRPRGVADILRMRS